MGEWVSECIVSVESISTQCTSSSHLNDFSMDMSDVDGAQGRVYDRGCGVLRGDVARYDHRVELGRHLV